MTDPTPRMRFLPAAGHRRMPWKNGGGETVEIAVFPEGAGLSDFEWRVSMAGVAAGGPFSTFEGVDRTLAVLSGEGLALDVGTMPPVVLTAASEPYFFPADRPARARLLGGPVGDLNVMTRRRSRRHVVRRLRIETARTLSLEGAATLLFCAAGETAVALGEASLTLGPADALLVERSAGRVLRLGPAAPSTLFLAAFDTP